MIGSNLRASLWGCLVLGCLSFDSFGDAYIRESGGSIVVGNDRVETVLDAKSGFVRALVYTVHERIELVAGEAGYRLYETAPSS